MRVPIHIVKKVNKINKNNKQNEEYAKIIEKWLKKYGYYFDNPLEYVLKIVTGEIKIDKQGKKYLEVNCNNAYENSDGVFCHQITRGEDWYTGELYFHIKDNEYLQVYYDC